MTKGVVIVAPTIVRYTFRHMLVGTKHCDAVFDVSIDTGPTGARHDAIADVNSHMSHWWQSNIIAPGYNNIVYLGAHWVDLDSTGGGTGDIGPSGSDPTSGTATGTFAPPNVAGLFHKHTAAARGTRPGRTYWPMLIESAVDNSGNVDPTTQSTWGGRFDAFRSVIADYTNEPVVGSVAMRVVHVHKPDKTDPHTWTWSSSDVTSMTMDPVAATQRRRLRH